MEKRLNELSPAHRALFLGKGGVVGSLKVIPFRPELFSLQSGLAALGRLILLAAGALSYALVAAWLAADGGRFAFLGGMGTLGATLQTGLLVVLALGALLLLWPFQGRITREFQSLRATLSARKNPQQFGFFLFPDTLLFRPRYDSVWVIPKFDVMGFEEGRRRGEQGEISFGKLIYRPLNVNYTLEFCHHSTDENKGPTDFTMPLGSVIGILRTWKAAK